MAKRLSTEDHLALLRNLRAAGRSESTIAALRGLLADSRLHGIVLKGAAAIAEEITASELSGELAAALNMLLQAEAKRDPGCEGKTAALKALVAWEANLPELYLEASRFHQMTSTLAGPKDVAAEFRGLAAIGIAITGPAGAVDRLVDLLSDPEKETRSRAATALGMWRGAEALPVLRLKARMGDADGEVMAEVFGSLLQQDPAQLELVAEFLRNSNPAIIEAAALALGQSKLEAALPALTAAWPFLRASPVATTLLMAVSLTRSDRAADWLIERLAESPTRGNESLALLDALLLYKSNAKVLSRIHETTAKRADLRTAYRSTFGT
jgi:HEAT repeat protein